MAETGREKLTIAFNNYESEQLNSIQISYLFGKGWYSLVPSINDILKGMVMFTSLEIKDGRVFRGFANNFLKSRHLPPTEEEYEQTEKTSRVQEERSQEEDIGVSPKFVRPKPGNYSFYFERKELKLVEKMRDGLSRQTGIDKSELSNPEIVRECMHLVLDKRFRNLDFRYATYVGFLYGLSPIVSVILSEMESKNSDGKRSKSLLNEFASKEQIETLRKIEKEQKQFEAFESKYKEFPIISKADDVRNVFGDYISEVGNFDYYLGYIGAEMMYHFSKSYVSEIPDILLWVAVNARKKYLLEGFGSFSTFVKVFLEGSRNFNKNSE